MLVVSTPPLRQPQVAIASQKVDENHLEKGVKGMLPLGCLPHWGREGVTLVVTLENNQLRTKEDFSRE
jgi:hypothetical protein